MLTRRAFFGAAGMAIFGLAGCSKAPASTDAALENLTADKIRSVSYEGSETAPGSSHTFTLSRNDDGSVTLEEWHRERANAEALGARYALDANVFAQFADIANDKDLVAASKRPDGELHYLDGTPESITYVLLPAEGEGEGATFTVSTSLDLTDEQHEGLDAVHTALTDLTISSPATPLKEGQH